MTAHDHARFALAVERLRELMRQKLLQREIQQTPALLKRQAE